MQPALVEHDINAVEQMIVSPMPLGAIVERVRHDLGHIDDPVGFTRSVLARLAQCSRASVEFTDGVPTWTRITAPERT